VLRAVRRSGAHFSVTVPANSSIQAAIGAIPEGAWTAIEYPQALWDDQLQSWVSDAEVAETGYTAFTSKKKSEQVTARLIVRRVRARDEQAAPGQGELFPAWRYHAVFTDSPFELVQAEGQHRDHAIVEQVIADLIAGPLAHLPSGVTDGKTLPSHLLVGSDAYERLEVKNAMVAEHIAPWRSRALATAHQD
jgi:hypothetical protein